jgi:hypothetical protein
LIPLFLGKNRIEIPGIENIPVRKTLVLLGMQSFAAKNPWQQRHSILPPNLK